MGMDNENQKNAKEFLVYQAESTDNFNERLLKVMTINQAISKYNKEIKVLENTRNEIISIMED